MYTQIVARGVREFARAEIPSGAIAFLVAEFFYKFHSFALECLAFLATWYVLSWLQSTVFRSADDNPPQTP